MDGERERKGKGKERNGMLFFVLESVVCVCMGLGRVRRHGCVCGARGGKQREAERRVQRMEKFFSLSPASPAHLVFALCCLERELLFSPWVPTRCVFFFFLLGVGARCALSSLWTRRSAGARRLVRRRAREKRAWAGAGGGPSRPTPPPSCSPRARRAGGAWTRSRPTPRWPGMSSVAGVGRTAQPVCPPARAAAFSLSLERKRRQPIKREPPGPWEGRSLGGRPIPSRPRALGARPDAF